MKLRNIYLSLALILTGLVNINLVSAMGGEDASVVAVPLVSRNVSVCEDCNELRDVLFETSCTTCLEHNLSTNSIMTLYINNHSGLAVDLLSKTSDSGALTSEGGYSLDCPFALDGDEFNEGLLERKDLESKDLSGYSSEEGLPESKDVSSSGAIIKCIR